MKKSKMYIIGIPIIIICIILIIIFVKQNQKTPLKVNEINIDGNVIQLTANKSDYSEYDNIEDFSVYDNINHFIVIVWL